jgi:hypothetical protein
MNKYLLFAGDEFYPEGGMDDFIGSYDTVAECQFYSTKYDWAHIAIYTTMTITMRRECSEGWG